MFRGKHRSTFMTNKSKTGKIGEDIACEFLKNKGYKIIERNFWQKWGELDIVAIGKDKTLVFVEVKTIRQSNNSASEILPEYNLTNAKLKKLQRTAMLYAGQNQNLIDENRGWGIDLVAITMFADQHSQVNHYENL